jgi:phospholipid transport system transporter-binding protein
MTTLALPAILTHNEAQDCLDQLLLALGEGNGSLEGPVRLNAKALSQFDSSALAVLLELRRGVLERQGQLVIEEPSAALLSLVKVYGVEDVLMTQSH